MFKKISTMIMVLLLALPLSALAQEWHTLNQATLTWAAVTNLSNGDPIPESDIIEYRVWLSNAITDPDKVNPVEIGVTAEDVYVITLNTEGRFFVGLQTIRKRQQGAEVVVLGESVIGWTDDPDIAINGEIFGLQYFLPPDCPRGVGLLD